MKKLIILCSVVFLFASVTAFKIEEKAEFKFEKETHDFGKIAQGKPVSVEFKFTNTGNEPLIITNIESVCGCTVPKYTNTPILKGQTGTITVTYNAAALAPFSKGLTIRSNAKTPIKVIYIKGEVVASPAG
ncbi:DUF1573 domain-containing protein [Daejeonella sp.]|jgi:hypothetical protein|uniref:DUF1573 domain-containing protein n=1 Tax=Daejeonella sp. TaxID=2805397 RepID=UPI0027BA57DB|nr:DUF1573 domain-containing protein [Daejeonella sp.]